MALMTKEQKSTKQKQTKIVPVLGGLIGGGAGLVVAVLAVVSPGTLGAVFGGGGFSGRSAAGRSGFPSAEPKVSGSFTATGGKLGDWTFEPNSCRSGQPYGFHGVFLTRSGDSQHRVKVARDVDGSILVIVNKPGTDKAMLYRKCQTLSASIRRTNTRVNMVWSMKGHVRVKCPGFEGKATFDGCH